MKNLNSFRFLKLALDYEIARQVGILESGGAIPQETRLFNPDTGETAGMRSKEHAHDYRYFPEPDLAPLRIADAWLDEIRAGMPELPARKRARFIESYGLSPYDADVLTASRAIAEYYERAAAVVRRAQSRRELGDGRPAGRAQRAKAKNTAIRRVTPERLGELVALIRQGRDLRQDRQGSLREDVFERRGRGRHHRKRRIETDQRYRRAGAMIDDVLRQNAEAGGAI